MKDIIWLPSKEEMQWIADFCSQKFLQCENSITALEEEFKKANLGISITFLENKQNINSLPEGIVVFLDVKVSQDNLKNFFVEVLGPTNDQKERISVTSSAKEYGTSLDAIADLLIKYKASELRMERIEITVPTEYEHQAQNEVLAILKSEIMQDIKSLTINFSKNFELPETLGDVLPKNVIELIINEKVFLHNQRGEATITEISKMVPPIAHLKHLSIGNICFDKIPQSLAEDFPSLISFELSRKEDNQALDINSVFKLKKLEHLSLKYLNLEKFPDGVLSMPKLEYLNISGNHIQDIPQGLGFTNLKYLDLSRNQIKSIENLPYQTLNYLDVSRNKLESLPEKILGYLTSQFLILGPNMNDAVQLNGNNNLSIEKTKDLEIVLGIENLQRILGKQHIKSPSIKIEKVQLKI